MKLTNNVEGLYTEKRQTLSMEVTEYLKKWKKLIMFIN